MANIESENLTTELFHERKFRDLQCTHLANLKYIGDYVYTDTKSYQHQQLAVFIKFCRYILYVEAVCNGMFGVGRDGMINPCDENRRFSLNMAEIAVFDQDVYDLIHDLTLLIDMAKVCVSYAYIVYMVYRYCRLHWIVTGILGDWEKCSTNISGYSCFFYICKTIKDVSQATVPSQSTVFLPSHSTYPGRTRGPMKLSTLPTR